MKNVLVAHPGTQHSQRVAIALKKANLLHKYASSFYWDESVFPCSIIHILPDEYKTKLRDLTFKRHNNQLDNNDVITYWNFLEIMIIMGGRIRLNKKFLDKIMFLKNQLFSKSMGNYCIKNKISCLVSYDTASYEAFKILEQQDKIIKVMDLSHPAWNYCESIIAEEEQLNPDFSSTIDHNVRDYRQLNKIVEEIKMADYIIVASTNSKRSLLYNGYNEQRIFVVPYGVDSTRYKPNFNKVNEKIKFLFVGSIGQRKGIKYLLEAFKQLDRTDIELHLVGQMIGDLEVYKPYSSHFIYHGVVSNSELPCYFAQADVFIFPSLIEGFGLVILEAMASGLPVICSENTGGYDIIENGKDGYILPIRDVERLKQSIEHFANNRSMIQEMGINARKKAEKYSWERYEDGLIRVFSKILK